MFQYEFCKPVARDEVPEAYPAVPADFLALADFACLRSSYWAEHCLECGEPLCYETCANYVPRADGRCRLFEGGIRDRHASFLGAPYAAEVRFRRWAKLETILGPGTLSPHEFMRQHDRWRARSLRANRALRGGEDRDGRVATRALRALDAAKYRANRKAGAPDWAATPWFVMQAYLYGNEPVTLLFEVTDGDDAIYRERIALAPGHNQAALDVSAVFPPRVKLRARIYPESDATPRIAFLLCEFVSLTPAATEKVRARVGNSGAMAGREQYGNPGAPATHATPAGADATAPAQKVKCVAWDLDNTVWDGTLIESSPDSLELRAGVLDTMHELDRRGIVQVVVSKNELADVVPVLERLGIDTMFVCLYVGWGPKSTSILSAAADIGIGVDTFALVDDSDFERREVADALPSVRVYDQTVVSAVQDGPALLKLPEFDVPVTADGSRRREMYRAEGVRKRASGAYDGDRIGFLRSCEMRLTPLSLADEAVLARSHELLQRTNQLNLSGTRHALDELAARVADPNRCALAFSCADKFGSYGQVLYLDGVREGDVLRIQEFAMSCRVASKFVEPAVIAYLVESLGLAGVVLEGRRTSRNGLLVKTFVEVGFEDRGEKDEISLVLPSPQALLHADVVSVR